MGLLHLELHVSYGLSTSLHVSYGLSTFIVERAWNIVPAHEVKCRLHLFLNFPY